MKKLMYLIVLTLILGLVLTGCLLSNVGQVPTSEQSGITYLTKNGSLPGLVGLWSFNEGTGITANDSSGTIPPNDGTIYGTSWVDGQVGFGKALSFDGSSDYVNAGSDASFDFTDKFTVEAWVNGKVFQGGYYDLIVFRGYSNWAFGAFGADRLIFGETAWNSKWSRHIYSDTLSWETDEWYHIAVVYDTVGKTADFYRDGVPVGVGKQSTDKFGITNLGDVTISYPHSVSFNCIIDEVRIWNTALTSDQLILYGFGGLMAPYAPPEEKTFKVGRTIPLKWQFTNLLGNSSAANPSVEIKPVDNGTTPVVGAPIEVDDPGNSGYQYDWETDTWQFNWQTKYLAAGLYHIWIINDWTGQTFGPFPIWLR